jgi:WD40 repeat protein
MEEKPATEQPVNLAVGPNITVTLKQDKAGPNLPDWERTARIMSLVAIPVVLAIIGAAIQATLGRSTVSRDYVQLAVSVLTADKTKTPQELRDWAVDLLNENSPTKFSKEVAARLKGGEIGFPGSIAQLLSSANSGGMAVSPDGRLVAVAKEREVRIWDLISTMPIGAPLINEGDVTSVAFSPNGLTLASGSVDATVRLWEVSTSKMQTTIRGATGPIVGVAFSPDGHLIARSQDGTVSFYDVESGRILRRIQIGR